MDHSIGKDSPIAIVGGSLVGPMTALLLQREGFTDVTVYEEMSAAQSRSGGIMGLRIPTIEAMESVGIDRREVVALRDNNTYAYDIAKGGVPVSRGVSDFPGVITSWDALHQRLASLVDIRYGTKVSGVGVSPGSQDMVLQFADGTQRPFALVVFADGRKSTGRELLDPTRRMGYQGYVVWRGLSVPPRPTPTGFNRYFDVSSGRLFSVTGPILQSGKSYWELSHNLDRDTWTALAGGTPEERAYLLPSKVGRLAREVVRKAARHLPTAFQSLVDDSEISGIPINDSRFPERSAFRVGNGWAVLLGDALIPVRLQVGAGLNQGLLEAVTLVQGLARLPQAASPDEVFDLMRRWEEATLDVMARWVELGRSRVGRLNLGRYEPVRPGWTSVPETDDVFGEPKWVIA